MKNFKILALTLAIIMIFTVCALGSGKKKNNPTDNNVDVTPRIDYDYDDDDYDDDYDYDQDEEDTSYFSQTTIGRMLLKNAWSYAGDLNTGLSRVIRFDEDGSASIRTADEMSESVYSAECSVIDDKTVSCEISYGDSGNVSTQTFKYIEDSQFVLVEYEDNQYIDEDLLYNYDTVNYNGSESFESYLVGTWYFSGDTPYESISFYEGEYSIKATLYFKNSKTPTDVIIFTFSDTFAKMFLPESPDSDGSKTVLIDKRTDYDLNLVLFDINGGTDANYSSLTR